MRGDGSFDEAGTGGRAIRWACRQAAIWGGIAVALSVLAAYGDRFLPRDAAPSVAPAPAPAPAPPQAATASDPFTNSLTYPADERGHVQLDADVDGAIVHFLVDTGASVVTLTRADAEAAGIGVGSLDFTMVVNTANGRTRAAPVMLREVRVGQLTLDNIQAAVLDDLSVSLLGMSFLSRLDRWEMQDGKLTIWY